MTLLHQAAQKAVEVLKPCPFCGNAAEHRERNGGYFVQCDTCDTRTASRLRPDYAAAHWNQRESALQQQPEPVASNFREKCADGNHCSFSCLTNELCLRSNYAARVLAERASPPALQHQEVPREPVAKDVRVSDFIAGAAWHMANPDESLDALQEAAEWWATEHASPSTTRQQEVVRLSDFVNAARINASDMPYTVLQKLQAAIDAAPSTTESGVSGADGGQQG